MENYFRLLVGSRLPIPFAFVVALWAAFYFSSFWLSRKAYALSLRPENPIGTISGPSPDPFTGRLMIGQIAVASYMFGSGYLFKYLDLEAASVFFSGGMAVASAVGFSYGLRSYLHSKAITSPGATEGRLDFSRRFMVQAQIAHTLPMATLCLCLGLLLANLSLCGGSFILFMTSIGYRRHLNSR